METPVDCYHYLKVNIIDYIQWAELLEWNMTRYTDLQIREHGKASNAPLRYIQVGWIFARVNLTRTRKFFFRTRDIIYVMMT